MGLVLDYAIGEMDSNKNLAKKFGLGPDALAWSKDAHVRKEIERFLAFAIEQPGFRHKALVNLDLSGEEPFDLSTAVIEGINMADMKFPKGTDLSHAHFIRCNLLDVNLDDCITK